MKNIIKGLGFVAVEAYFYFKTSPEGMESFFFGWSFLFATLFLYNTFSFVFHGNLMSSGGLGKANLANVSNQHHDRVDNNNLKKRSGLSVTGGLRDRMNLIYLLLLVVNVFGYIQVMPK